MEIPILYKGQEYVALVDDEDAELAQFFGPWRLQWHTHDRSKIKAAVAKISQQHSVLLHRLVLGLVGVSTPLVDHINRNPLDCQKSNLRLATQAQNLQNRSPRGNRNNRSGYRGVRLASNKKAWEASHRLDGVTHHIGRFPTAEEAGAAAAAWRAEHMPFATS